ncbi:hypothetical protein Anas_00372 [Armadillidium nasatum]|uniref:Uncharacterized protein n=1 Tax=Armadillidium nasatum TaxID=96803 RepID=A0A5N5SKM0_9CRUS|nr:hypothetical protein Anas_00372 [Armadillidium nasatum]
MFMKFFQMLKLIIIIGAIFVGVFSNRLKSRLGFSTEYPWPHPFKAFLQNSLPTADKCLATTFIDVSELISDSRCELDDKINVICEIPF